MEKQENGKVACGRWIAFQQKRSKKIIIRKKSKDATRDHINASSQEGRRKNKEIFRINSQKKTIDVNRLFIYILRLSHFGGFF